MWNAPPCMRLECAVPRAQRGLTLIELMVGVTVLSILLLFAVPSFQGTIARSRLTSSTNDLVSAMALARSEAIRRGTRVTVCKTANGTACTTSGGWQQGWLVFADPTRGSAAATVDAGETVIAVAGARPGNINVLGTANFANFVSFAADGTVRTMNGTSMAGRLRVCSNAGALTDATRARELDITSAGRLATTVVNVTSACVAPT